MSGNVEFVGIKAPASIKVGKHLLAKGYDLATHTGLALGSLIECDAFGILLKDPEVKLKTYFFGLVKRAPRRMFLGVVWFDNKDRNATEVNWVFDVYGRKHVDRIGRMAEELADTFNVKVTVRLACEQPSVETCLSDYDAADNL